jgi:hypothetical protein
VVSWKVERLENAIFRETAFFFNANREPRSKPRRQRALHYLRGIRVRNLFASQKVPVGGNSHRDPALFRLATNEVLKGFGARLDQTPP